MQNKVAYILGALNQGGMEALTLDLFNHRQSADFDMLCIYRHEGNKSEEFHRSDVPMLQLTYTNVIFYLWQLRKLLLREKVTIVHAQTQSNAIVCILALIGTGIPVITTLHGFSFSKSKWLYRRIVYRGCRTLLCVSKYQMQYYKNVWHLLQHNKLQVVYNGVNFEKIDSAKASPDFPENGRIRLVSVGNFVKGRSPYVIANSVHLLKQRGYTDVEIYFVGRRVEHEAWRYDDCVRFCQETHLDNVHFLGGRDDVPAILKSMDGFVYSTDHDTFGIALVEAMAAKLPIVVNDWPVMKEVCDLHEYARNEDLPIYFYQSKNSEDCANQIQKMIDDIRSDKKKQAAKCRILAEAVHKKYAIEKHIQQLQIIYRTITNDN